MNTFVLKAKLQIRIRSTGTIVIYFDFSSITLLRIYITAYLRHYESEIYLLF